MKSKIETVNASELARRSDYSAAAISAWTRAGKLTRTKGHYNLIESLAAIKRHEQGRFTDGSHDSEGLLDLKRELLTRRIAKIDFELSVAKGELHSKVDCCQSLIALRGLESRALHSLGAKVSSRLPEVPGIRGIVDAEVDGIILRLHQVFYDEPPLFCPHCHVEVTELVAEPTEAIA